jgi:3-oxoacyl-[acyl-carrier protein] reductase
MDLELRDKVAFVGGGTRGIGLAIAEAFVREGAHVVLTGRTSTTLKQAAARCRAIDPSRQVLELEADLTEPDAVRRTLDDTAKIFPRLDVAVANVGTGVGTSGWAVDPTEWEQALRVNLLSGVLLAGQALPWMVRGGGGAFIFISSIAGWEAMEAPIAYTAAKAGALAAMKAIARQSGGDGVRVNAVVPGNVLFGGGTWDRKLNADRSAVNHYIETTVPLRRFGTPEEVADAVLFLSSRRAAFVTGACLVVDGGQTRSL